VIIVRLVLRIGGKIWAGVAALWQWGVRADREEEEEEYHVEKDE
jgi:hypothetical protein